jgi:SHS2 domain-containing protein
VRELVLEGATLEEVLAAAAVAVGAQLAPDEGEPDRVPILVKSPDVSSLLRGFIEDILYLAEIERFAVDRVERIQVDGGQLRAAVSGRTGAGGTVEVDSVELSLHGTLWRLRISLA